MAIKRKLPDIITTYREMLSESPSPDIFNKWTAMWMISASVQRNVWCHTKKSPWYPNIYVLCVAIPGIGKSVTIDTAQDLMLDTFGPHKLTVPNLTRAAFSDHLSAMESHQTPVDLKGRPLEDYWSAHAVISEMGNLFPVYDAELVALLTKGYDCTRYGEKRRGGGGKYDFDLPRTCVTFLAGSQPNHLERVFTEAAWQEGFMSRTTVLYSDEWSKDNLFSANDDADIKYADTQEYKDIMHDLKAVAKMYGKFKFTPEAKELANNFNISGRWGGDPIPTHPRMNTYNTRRTGHLLKYMQLSSLSRIDGNMIITADDYHRAYEWMIEGEATVPYIFKSIKSGGDSQIIRDVLHDIGVEFKKTKKLMTQAKIKQIIMTKNVQAYNIENIFKQMIAAEYLITVRENNTGPYLYYPRTDAADEI